MLVPLALLRGPSLTHAPALHHGFGQTAVFGCDWPWNIGHGVFDGVYGTQGASKIIDGRG